MIYYDITKMGAARHRSGLMRLTSRLMEELGSAITPVAWDERKRAFATGRQREPVKWERKDWFLTVEMFSESERPGISAFLKNPPCRLAAMFHDAIPLRFPHITWPQSVQRHPEYMKLLAGFEHTWAISEETKKDFMGFWHWQGVEVRAQVEVIELGADFDGGTRVQRDPLVALERPALLSVGIVEPRKNQSFLLDVCEALWRENVDFELAVIGRINPHFGNPIAARMKALEKRESRFRFHAAAGDRELAGLYTNARAVAFPTIAEGCGLPLLEALWRGVPCVASDLPVLRENVEGGGCLVAAVNQAEDWRMKLRSVLTDAEVSRRLQGEAMARTLPRWTDAAQAILKVLR
jgi:glycosyltransferase involved in cell wall biosynthesis